MEHQCTACGSDRFVLLGNLGRLTWVRCRQCGWDQAVADVVWPDELEEVGA